MNQLPLLRGPHLPSVFRYETLFSHLPALPQKEDAKRGRKAYDHNILLRALIYRCLRQIPTLTEVASIVLRICRWLTEGSAIRAGVPIASTDALSIG